MLFPRLSQYLEKLEKTASRNGMTLILAQILKEAKTEEADKICYLLLGELLPPYTGVEFNIAEKMMIQVLSEAYGINSAEVEKRYKTKGDLGNVAENLASLKQTAPKKKLSVKEVYERLLQTAQESGEGSQERKIQKLSEILKASDSLSAKFVARIPVGKLRLGFSEATLLDALSLMERGDKLGRPQIEQAFNVTADIGAIARRIKKSGISSLKRLGATPGIPIRPSLAERIDRIEEIFEKTGAEVGVEKKLDGLRSQLHVFEKEGKRETAIFSRNLENTTTMFPEIVNSASHLKVRSVVLDGETVGYDPSTGKFAKFQETIQRKRKYRVAEFAQKIPLYIFVFDVLYLDGKSLLQLPFKERRKILERILTNSAGSIKLAPQKIIHDPGVIREELKKSLEAGLEGLVVKNLELPYEAGGRGFHWIKLKAATALLEKLRAGEKKQESKMLDTIDCVVMGAYKGKGKRAKFGIGGFLLGVRGDDDRYYTISRLGSGLRDEEFKEANQRIMKLSVISQPKDFVVDKEIAPDIWVRPGLVVEILADEITLSPRHTAARKKEGERGYSLRFPRLVRFREDKKPEDATTVKEMEELYKRQR